MAAIERLDLPTNVPVVGKVKFKVDRDDPGKEFPSGDGGTFRTWGVPITVMSNHPDGPPPGTVGRLSLYKEDWDRFLEINPRMGGTRSEEHTSELQSRLHLVCRLLLEKKKKKKNKQQTNK